MTAKKAPKDPKNFIPFPGNRSEGAQGDEVRAITRALKHAHYLKTSRNNFDSYVTGAVQRYKRRHPGIGNTTGVYDQKTHSRLVAEHHFDNYGAYLLKKGIDEDNTRAAIVHTAMFAYAHRPRRYSQDEMLRMQGLLKKIKPPHMWTVADCSGFATWCYWVAGAPDPNGWDFEGYPANLMYTGTMGQNGSVVSRAAAQPGDLALYGSAPFVHVGIIIRVSPLPIMQLGHGHAGGPYYQNIDYHPSGLGQIRSYL